MTNEDIARVAHEVNRAYCISQGDHSQVSWDLAPNWQKESSLNGVTFILANLDAGPEAAHNNWMKEKKEEGWKYGEVKDAEKKTHPCMVPFQYLAPQQQAKDFLFRAIVIELDRLRRMAGEVAKG